MRKTNNVCFLLVILITVSIIACDIGEGEKPWTGQKIYEMDQGSSYSFPSNIIRYSDAGKTHWYYIDARKDMTYEIGFYLPVFYWEQIGKPTYAVSYMTCYKEDGTIIVTDKKSIGGPIYYYSSSNQRLHIRFKFQTAGFIAFYYKEHEDYNEYEDDNEYYR